MIVYVIIDIVDGLIDTAEVFTEKEKALSLRRTLIGRNTPFTKSEIKEMHSGVNLKDVLDQDSNEYMFSPYFELYFPISTDNHDVVFYETTLVEG